METLVILVLLVPRANKVPLEVQDHKEVVETLE
jgi:hypothetical protein